MPPNHSNSTPRMGSDEDMLARAVRVLTSPKSRARVACSVCGEVALKTTVEAMHLGGSNGNWSRNPHVGALFVRTRDPRVGNIHWNLLVKRGAVVLCAQQVITAGLVHEIKGTGFRTALTSMTHHECYKCSKVPGQSLRLRVDAQVSIAAEVAYIDATLRMLVLENTTMRLCCSKHDDVSVCSADIHGGVILAPPRIDNGPSHVASTPANKLPRIDNGPSHVASTPANRLKGQGSFPAEKRQAPRKSMLKTHAMGGVETPVDERNTQPHGQLLYFSRNTGKNTEAGVLVWVVDQSLAVIEVDDVSEVFTEEAKCYNFTPLNIQCESHQREYPRPCAVCAKSICDEKSATTVEGITGPVMPIHDTI